MTKYRLTTECGYRWRWDYLYHWKAAHKLRPLYEDGEKIGVAFGPVMFFWKWS